MNRRCVSISGFLLSFFPLLYDFSPERCRSVRKGANVAVPCVGPFLFYGKTGIVRFYGARSSRYDLRWPYLSLYVFTYLSTKPTTSGGPIFRCTTKDRGERRAKGLRPLESPGVNGLGHSDVLCANRLAMVRVTRLSRAWRAPHCFHALCVLHCSVYGDAYDFLRSLRGALVRRGNLL